MHFGWAARISFGRAAALAVILGLLREQADASKRLRALPATLPSSYDRFIVACPGFVPIPSARRELESLHIHLVALGGDDLVFELGTATKQSLRPEPRVILTEQEEHELAQEAEDEHCGGRGDKETPITEVPLRLFMRLVVALLEKTRRMGSSRWHER